MAGRNHECVRPARHLAPGEAPVQGDSLHPVSPVRDGAHLLDIITGTIRQFADHHDEIARGPIVQDQGETALAPDPVFMERVEE